MSPVFRVQGFRALAARGPHVDRYPTGQSNKGVSSSKILFRTLHPLLNVLRLVSDAVVLTKKISTCAEDSHFRRTCGMLSLWRIK